MSETTSFDDKLLYAIEEVDGEKIVHVLGELYCVDCGEEKDYRLAEFTGVYLEFGDIQKHISDLIDFIYDSSSRVYQKDISKSEAEECFKSYFSSKEGIEFNILECDQNTPCGNYWC